MRRSLFALAAMSAVLCGCGLDEKINQMNQETDRRNCASYGFTPGTDAFATCMMKQAAQRDEENQRIQDRAALDRAMKDSKK